VARRLLARLGQAAVVLWVVLSAVFLLIHAAPGDPFSFDAPNISPAIRAQWRAAFGYDRPLGEQYVRYLSSALHGDLGYSHSMHEPVRDALAAALPRTLLLMGVALALSFALGVWLALVEVRYAGTWRARLTHRVALFFYSLPDFWLALVMLMAFAYWLPLFPAGGIVDPVLHDYMSRGRALLDLLRHLVLPALTLTLLSAAAILRYQRSELLEVLPMDFVRTARAKGLDEHTVLRRHVLRNALLPVITLLGLAFPALLGGALFVEKVFAWPGMGYLAASAIDARDYPLVLASVVVGSCMVIIGNLAADVLYRLADPRLRRQ
jgi:peptide/nickel transport system permease protein